MGSLCNLKGEGLPENSLLHGRRRGETQNKCTALKTERQGSVLEAGLFTEGLYEAG